MKISYENKEFIRQIQDVCLNINQYTEHSAFYNFSGHVNSFSISVAKDKENFNERIYSSELYMNALDEEEIHNRLRGLLSNLQEIENGNWEVIA